MQRPRELPQECVSASGLGRTGRLGGGGSGVGGSGQAAALVRPARIQATATAPAPVPALRPWVGLAGRQALHPGIQDPVRLQAYGLRRCWRSATASSRTFGRCRLTAHHHLGGGSRSGTSRRSCRRPAPAALIGARLTSPADGASRDRATGGSPADRRTAGGPTEPIAALPGGPPSRSPHCRGAHRADRRTAGGPTEPIAALPGGPPSRSPHCRGAHRADRRTAGGPTEPIAALPGGPPSRSPHCRGAHRADRHCRARRADRLTAGPHRADRAEPAASSSTPPTSGPVPVGTRTRADQKCRAFSTADATVGTMPSSRNAGMKQTINGSTLRTPTRRAASST